MKEFALIFIFFILLTVMEVFGGRLSQAMFHMLVVLFLCQTLTATIELNKQD